MFQHARPGWHSCVCLHALRRTAANSVIEFHSPVQHMGKDGYSTHKYYSVSPDCLVLQENSFQFEFVFTSLADQNKHRSHRSRTCCVVLRHLLTLCFSNKACRCGSAALIRGLRRDHYISESPRRAVQITDDLMSEPLREPQEHIRPTAAHFHTLHDHTARPLQWENQIQMTVHARTTSVSVCVSVTYVLPPHICGNVQCFVRPPALFTSVHRRRCFL